MKIESANLFRNGLAVVIAWVFVGIAVIIYFPSLFGEFVWDDQTYFVENDVLTGYGPSDIRKVFLHSSNYWGEHLPLRDYLYVLEYSAFGENPMGYHVVSLVLYVVSALVLLRWARFLFSHPELTPSSVHEQGRAATLGALIVFALFLFNPTYVESVAYISGQKDVLSLFFILLSLFYLSRLGSAAGGRWVLLFVFGTLFHYFAVLSKYSALATIVLVPILWSIMSRRALSPRIVRDVVAWLLVNIPVIWWVFSPRMVSAAGASPGSGTPLPDRVVRAIEFLGFYFPHTIWPWPLSFGYGSQGQVSFEPYLFVGLAIVIVAAILLLVRRRSLFTLGLLVFIIYLLPVLQIYPDIANAKVFDRYLAMPAIGIVILIAAASDRIANGWQSQRSHVIVALASWSIAWVLMTINYIPSFGNRLAAMEHQYRLYPESPTAFLNLADTLIYSGHLEEAEKFVRENSHFEQPDWLGDFLLGQIHLERDELDEAYRYLYAAGMKTHRGGYFPVADVFLAEVVFKRGNPVMAKRILGNLLSQERKDPLVTMKAKKLLEQIEIDGSNAH